ncbi:MAG: hypothetical protein Q4D99_01765 [Bacillota bacterium]|nr:hypothetical protein [Bacillota bacterium]
MSEEPVIEEEDAEEAGETAEAAETPETDYEKVVALAEYVQEEEPAAGENVEESTYDAFLMQEACEDMDIEACVITTIDADGNLSSYNEIMIDGQLYILDASEGITPEEYVPEEIN